MALFGMLIGHIWSRAHIRRSRIGRSIGIILTTLVLAETIADMFIPMVSGAGHIGGLLFGLLAGVSPLSGQPEQPDVESTTQMQSEWSN